MQFSKKYLIMSTVAITLAIFIFTACKKKEDAADTGFSTEQASASRTADDAQSIGDQANVSSSSTLSTFRTTIGGCATITRDSVSIPHTITITFTSGCTCVDGKVRSGSIIVSYTGHYFDSGSTHTISFNNYVVDGNQVNNSSYRTVTNIGSNTWKVTDQFNVLMSSATNSTHWSAHRIRTLTSGTSNANYIYSITDQAGYADTLIRANGNVVTNLITSPIIYNMACIFRLDGGTILHTFANNTTATLTINTGCAGTATLQYNGHTYIIPIP